MLNPGAIEQRYVSDPSAAMDDMDQILKQTLPHQDRVLPHIMAELGAGTWLTGTLIGMFSEGTIDRLKTGTGIVNILSALAIMAYLKGEAVGKGEWASDVTGTVGQ